MKPEAVCGSKVAVAGRRGEATGRRLRVARAVSSMGGAALFLLLAASPPIRAQDQASAQMPAASAAVQPAVGELRTTLGGLRIAKWKAPGPVKEDAEQNIGSINRDLDNTLAGLLAQADAPPRSVANVFAVYRNLDALYEVLLRVSGTAELAAPDAEAAAVSHALATLDGARRSLADSILAASRGEEAQLVELRQSREKAVAAPQPPPATTVVNDGPSSTTAARKKPKPKPKAPAAEPQG